MKKISSKIIISLVLATILWSGVGDFLSSQNIKKYAIIKEVSAATDCTNEKKAYDLATPGTPERIAAGKVYSACIKRQREELNPRRTWWGRRTDDALNTATSVVEGVDDAITGAKEWAGNLVVKGIVTVLTIILSFFNWVLVKAGNMFDATIEYSIFKMSSYKDILDSIEEAWVIFRNILNISFIFILLWISIKTIIGLTGSNTKKMIASVVVAALLINFSLFITKIIIDSGNYVSAALISEVRGNDDKISSLIVNNTGLSALYQPREGDDGQSTESIIFIIVKIILAAIMAWAFFSAAVLFAIRIIAFFILMVFSPIGFVGEIIPYLKPQAKKWWDTLYSQCLVAPIFLFFMLIIIKITASNSLVLGSNDITVMDVGAYFNMLIIVAFIIIAVKTTKKTSGEFGGIMTGLGATVVGTGLGIASGGAASIFRNTVGKRASEALEGEKGDALRERAKTSAVARMQLRAANNISKNNFDIRSTKVGSLIKKAGIDTNKGLSIQKGGAAQIKKDTEKEDEEKAKLYTGEVSNEHISKEREKIENSLKENEKQINEALLVSGTSPENTAKLDKLQKEEEELKRRKKLSDGDMKKEIKVERIKKLAEREEKKGKLLGLEISKRRTAISKAKAEKIRKAIKEKTSAETWQEMIKKEAEEQRKKEAETNTPPTPPTSTPPTPKTP